MLRTMGEDARLSQAYSMAVGRVDQRNFRRQQIDMADSRTGAARNHAWMIGGQFGPKVGGGK